MLDAEIDAWKGRVAKRADLRCRYFTAKMCYRARDEADIDGTRAVIIAGPETPYIVVKKLLFGANRNGLIRVDFIARNSAGESGRLAIPALGPCLEWDPNATSCDPRCVRHGRP